MKLKNQDLFGHFVMSFNNLTAIKQLPADVKFQLVKLKGKMIEHGKVVEETIKSFKGDEKAEDKTKEIMEQECSFKFTKIDPMMVANHLSTDDLFMLSPLLKEEK